MKQNQCSRNYKKKIELLKHEFDSLKAKLFKDSNFIVADTTNSDLNRYQQLLGFFYPNFRYKGWVSPFDEMI